MSKRCKWGHDTPQPTCPDCMQPYTSVHYATGTGKPLAQQNQELRERLTLITDAANRVQENREHMGSILFAGLLNILRNNAESAAELLGEGNDG